MLQGEDFAPVRLGPQNRVFELLEKPLSDEDAFGIVGRSDLEVNARHLSVKNSRTKQDGVTSVVVPEEPQAVLEASHGQFLADIDILVLGRGRHHSIFFVSEHGGKADPFVGILFSDAAEMADDGAVLKKGVDRPLKIGSDPEWELPF